MPEENGPEGIGLGVRRQEARAVTEFGYCDVYEPAERVVGTGGIEQFVGGGCQEPRPRQLLIARSG